MRFTDLCTGLAFVAGHVGLARLDQGLRDGVTVPLEQLQAHVQLVTRAAQAALITGQIDQLRGKAAQFEKQNLNAQHAQLMVQVSQLQLQLQQYQIERKRLELELEKEKRLAQENEILRIFVDLFNQALIYRQMGQYLDFMFVVAAAYRIYRQVYADLDDANNRLRLAELRERLLQGAREVVADHAIRQQMLQTYVSALGPPMTLSTQTQQAIHEASTVLVEAQGLRVAPTSDAWDQGLQRSAGTQSRLRQSKTALTQLADEHRRFLDGQDVRELFLYPNSQGMNELIASLGENWIRWRQSVDDHLGRPTLALSLEMASEPQVLEVRSRELDQADAEVGDLQRTYQLGQTVATRRLILNQFDQDLHALSAEVEQTPTPPAVQDPIDVFGRYLHLRQIHQRLAATTGPFVAQLNLDQRIRNPGYLKVAGDRLARIGALEAEHLKADAKGALALVDRVYAVEDRLSNKLKTCREWVSKAIQVEEVFMRLREALTAQYGTDFVHTIEVAQASAQPGVGDRLKALFRSEQGNEVDRRNRFLDAIANAFNQASQAPRGVALPALPELPPAR